jgi:hypothetical protein
MNFAELSNEQRRQLIDAQQAYAAWRPASRGLSELGSLIWQTSKGKRYLVEQHHKIRKSLGRETPELRKRKQEHDAKRAALKSRISALKKRLNQMAPVNRALGLGRMPKVAAGILRELDRESLLGTHIIVIGTNALFAYEAATGTVLSSEHVATTDADLLWDSSQSLLLAATGVKREGLLGILKRVDHSFSADYGLNPTNKDGYIVDLLCPETDDFQTMRVGADIEATQMPGVDWLIAAPQLEAIIVGEDGRPVRIVVPEPRTFALHKLWVASRSDRQPPKRARDRAHAFLVAELVRTYLRQPFTIKDMPWLPQEVRPLVKELRTAKT